MNRSLFFLIFCFRICLIPKIPLMRNAERSLINTFRNSNTGNKCKKGAPRISAGGTFYFHPCFFCHARAGGLLLFLENKLF